MKEIQEMKETLQKLADNLETANGVVLIRGSNSENSKDVKVDLYDLNPHLTLSALLATAYEVYVSSLYSLAVNLRNGTQTEEEVNEINKMLESMFKKFNSLQKEKAEQSYACRKGIIKSLEKEN
jgi:hypothetical protein